MADKKNATSGKLVAGSAASTNGNLSQGHYTMEDGDPNLPNFDAMVDGSLTTADQLEADQAEVTAETLLLTEGPHDEGNAQCVHARHAGSFAYNDALGWLHHTGAYWRSDGAELAADRAIVDTLKARAIAALQSGQAEQYDKLIKFSIPNKNRIQGAKYLLSSLVAGSPAEFDADPDRLNCRNGVVDLRTGQLQPHSPDQRFTHCATVAYRPDASSQKWVDWLSETVGAEVAEWLQLAVGYSLTGHTSEEILFYLVGPPRAGKGLFTETLLALLGSPLAKEVNFGTFTAQRTGDSQNFDLAPLRASRLIAASESNSYERFNEAKIKALTGGNEVYCAFKHKTHFGYRPQFKIWLSSNQPVNADPDDDAVWGRLRVVEFPTSHLGSEDKTLKATMRSSAVLEGVLAWAVQGAIKWYELGAAGLPELKASALLKEQQRGDLDNVGAWISECCEVASGNFGKSADLYSNYSEWCKASGITAKKQKGLTVAIKRKGFAYVLRKIDGKTYRGFAGIGVNFA